MNKVPSVDDVAVAFGQRHPNPCLLVDADTMKLVAHERAVGALLAVRVLGEKLDAVQIETVRIALDVTEKTWVDVRKELGL